MANLKLIVKSKSKAEQHAHALRKAADHLKDTALYLKQIVTFLEESSYVHTDDIVSDTRPTPSSKSLTPDGRRTSDLATEDIEAALILTSMRADRVLTSAELEAAVALTVLQTKFTADIGVSQKKKDQEQSQKLSARSPKGGRVLRLRAGRVMKVAPKTVPNQAKQNTILAYLQSSLTVHSIKDLEKSLPSVAGINGMQVKDFLQALSDEGQIRVEKIGSGNWYWSFASEAKKERTDTLTKLQEEKEKIDASLGELQAKVEEASAIRGQDPDREAFIERRLALEHEVELLKKELEGYKDGDPGEVELRRKEITAYQMKAEKWTDNIGILEGQMLNSMGGDREKLDGIKKEIYGDEYVEGEGLREL